MRISDPYYVEAAGKVLDVLQLFGNRDESLRLVEIAEELGMTKSTAFRLVYTLERKGYVTRDLISRRYRSSQQVDRITRIYAPPVSSVAQAK